MRPSLPVTLLWSVFVWIAPVILSTPAFAETAVAPPETNAARERALFNQYCSACHNKYLKSGGISFAELDTADVRHNSAILERVLQKLHAGEMPPAGMPRPDAATIAGVTKGLVAELDRAAAEHPDPGRPTIHRLNRAEYSNAVRDLLALDIKPGAKLPTDDTGYGFDNIGDVLSLSPMLVERYMSVARIVSRLAVGDTALKPEVAEFRAPRGSHRRDERPSDDMPFDSGGGLSVAYRFPVDADYIIKVKLAPTGGFDGSQVGRDFEYRVPVKAGTRHVAVTFPRQDSAPEVIFEKISTASRSVPPVSSFVDLRLDDARLKTFDLDAEGGPPALATITIAGPYDVAGPGETSSRHRIFVCTPATVADEAPCARQILTTLAHHAFRRPVTDADIAPLLAFYNAGRRNGAFDSGIESALRALLVSPDFLFRIEHDPAGLPPATAHRVSDVELASRLSFFLWSTIPDDELLNLAEQNRLHDPAVLAAQVNRMLEDERGRALVDNFAGQWLYLRNLTQVRPDPDEFPEFDNSLRHSFERETDLFFSEILRSGRPITDLLDANFTYLNQRLAEHYGIPNIYGSQFRRVVLDDPERGGLLGQGSILTVTSYPNRTSVVQRGKWVLENLLGSPPPPPPPNVPSLKPHGSDGSQLTMRQAMEQHRANPTCAACHARMDPIGFALENYDGVGKWRVKDAGQTIDATGTLPDGTTFDGLAGLRELLLTKRRDQFIDTVAERLLTYALGRGLESYDKPAVRSIVRQAAAAEPSQPAPSFHALIHAIVTSVPFEMRRTPDS